MQRTDRGPRRRLGGPAAGLVAVALAGLAAGAGACPRGAASLHGPRGQGEAVEAVEPGREAVRNADGVLTRLPAGAVLAEPDGHLARVRCLAFSPDGRQLVSGSDDGSLIVWDAETGERAARLVGHAGFVGACAFLPDGRVVSGGWGGEVLVWAPATGRLVGRLRGLRENEDVYSLAVRPDGAEVMAGTRTGRVMAWRLAGPPGPPVSGGAASRVGRHPAHTPTVAPNLGEIAFDRSDLRRAPDSSTIWTVGWLDGGSRFAGGDAGHVLVWQRDGAESRRVAIEPSSGIALPGGRLLLGREASITVVERDGTTRALGAPGEHAGWLYGLAASPRGDVVLSGDSAGIARVWGVADGQLLCSLAAGAGGARLVAAAFASPTGSAGEAGGARFAVAGDDGAVVVVRASARGCQDGRVVPPDRVTSLAGRRSRVSAVAAGARPGDGVLVGDGTGRVTAWSLPGTRLPADRDADPGDPRPIRRAWPPRGQSRARAGTASAVHQGAVTSLVALPGGGWAAGGVDNLVSWAGSGAMPRAAARLSNQVRGLTVWDRSRVIAVDFSGALTVVDLESGSARTLAKERNPLYAVTRHPIAARVVASGLPNHLLVVDLTDLHLAEPATPDHEPVVTRWPDPMQPQESPTALAYRPDGRQLAAAGTDGTVVLLDPASGQVARRLSGLRDQVLALVFTPGQLWAGGNDRVLARWPVAGDARPGDAPVAGPLRIPTGAIVTSLAATPDYRFLIAGLDDGRALVRALPDGEAVAEIIPLRDGSWAVIHADGRVDSSGDGLARGLRFVVPGTRQVVALGERLPPRIGDIAATRLPSGAVAVAATVFSLEGPPVVTLDGRWPITAVTPSESVPSAYAVAFLLDDAAGARHALEARVPGQTSGQEAGRAARREFQPEPDPRAATDPRAHQAPAPGGPPPARALIIGNSAYQRPGVPALPGAARDADNVRAAFARDNAWGLPPDRISVRRNLPAHALADAIREFFAKAEPGETLLFYYAGHGIAASGHGYLLGVDHDPAAAGASGPGPPRGTPGSPGGAVSAKLLWEAIAGSPAAQVVVVLDACRAGAFVFPQSEAARAEAIGKLGVLTSSSAGASATGGPDGGLFTRAFVRALRTADAVDPRSGTITLFSAYLYAASRAASQSPRIFGGLDGLVLAAPPRDIRVAQSGARTGAGASVVTAEAALVTERRQVTGRAEHYQGEGQHAVRLRVTFGHRTQSLRVRVARPGDERPTAELFRDGPWPESARTELYVDLPPRPRPGRYTVELTPCRAADSRKRAGKRAGKRPSCDDDPPVMLRPPFTIGVKGGGKGGGKRR